jgi:hypothetical protein
LLTEIRFNGLLTAATWTDLSGTDTMSQYDTSATAILGGDVLFSSYTDGTGNGTSGTLPIDTGAQLYISTGIEDDVTGTSSGSNTTTTLNDTTKTWATNQFTATTVLITGGTGSGQERTISSNTATELTIAPIWTTTPDGTSTYDINTSDIVTFCGQKTGGTSPTGYPAMLFRELF